MNFDFLPRAATILFIAVLFLAYVILLLRPTSESSCAHYRQEVYKYELCVRTLGCGLTPDDAWDMRFARRKTQELCKNGDE